MWNKSREIEYLKCELRRLQSKVNRQVHDIKSLKTVNKRYETIIADYQNDHTSPDENPFNRIIMTNKHPFEVETSINKRLKEIDFITHRYLSNVDVIKKNQAFTSNNIVEIRIDAIDNLTRSYINQYLNELETRNDE